MNSVDGLGVSRAQFGSETIYKSKHERNEEKRGYKDRFKKYLHGKNKNRHNNEDQNLDFDRYECTSPNRQRVRKDYNVEYKEMKRVDPSGLTEKQLEQAAE